MGGGFRIEWDQSRGDHSPCCGSRLPADTEADRTLNMYTTPGGPAVSSDVGSSMRSRASIGFADSTRQVVCRWLGAIAHGQAQAGSLGLTVSGLEVPLRPLTQSFTRGWSDLWSGRRRSSFVGGLDLPPGPLTKSFYLWADGLLGGQDSIRHDR